ncbi:MAG: P27 family phage terminase small subunit [Acidobacteriota bacterium]|jgi:phage terminase small subunit
MNTTYTAPNGLSPRAAELWREIVPRQAKSPERLAMVEQALRAYDRAEQCREAIDSQGLMIEGGKLAHINPLLKAEKDARAQFAQMWRALRLTFSGSVDGRQVC